MKFYMAGISYLTVNTVWLTFCAGWNYFIEKFILLWYMLWQERYYLTLLFLFELRWTKNCNVDWIFGFLFSVVGPDNSFEMLIDNTVVNTGNLLNDVR